MLSILIVGFGGNFLLAILAFIVAAALAALGGWAFMVRVPEGTTALLVQAGRHRGTLGPGGHVVMPWVAVSHIVTRRQIPFELPRAEALTSDNVRARIDMLVTFAIADPGRFVYAIAAPDFDLVLQAAGQDGVRTLFRTLTWTGVLELDDEHSAALRSRIEAHVQPFGVEISHLALPTRGRTIRCWPPKRRAACRGAAAKPPSTTLAGALLDDSLSHTCACSPSWRSSRSACRRRCSRPSTPAGEPDRSETQAAHLRAWRYRRISARRGMGLVWTSSRSGARAGRQHARGGQLGHLTDAARTVLASGSTIGTSLTGQPTPKRSPRDAVIAGSPTRVVAYCAAMPSAAMIRNRISHKGDVCRTARTDWLSARPTEHVQERADDYARPGRMRR